MTPADAATHARTSRATRPRARRGQAARPARRVSGPAAGARSARRPLPAAAGAGTVALPPLAVRVARAGARIGDARLLDRLVRGRGWIALVAVGLMGIVFMQVSMLRLNAGISRAVTSAETLERQNSSLRADISKLDAGERIQDTATALGMLRPPAGQVNYLDARKANGRAAAKAIRKPDPVKVTPPATAGTQQTQTGTTAAQGQAAAVQAQTPAAQAQAATTPASATPTTATQPQTATQPTATEPTATQPQAPAPTATQPQAPVTTAAPPAQAQAPAQTQTQPQAQQAPAATTAGAPAAQGAQ
jgi:cell division protein FtsL